jgi:hypothetical protein
LIKDILQPCEVRDVEFNDGFVREKFVTATVQVVAAEGLLPLTPRERGVEADQRIRETLPVAARWQTSPPRRAWPWIRPSP